MIHGVLSAIASQWNYSLTEHVQADFLGFLPCLVLGDASVISFIHFLDIFYYQFWTILVQAVLITRFKDDVVTVAEGKKRGRHISGGCASQAFAYTTWGAYKQLFFNSLTMICSRLFLGKAAAGTQQRQEDQKKSCPVLNVSESIHNTSTAFVCLSSSLALTSVF